jgi:CrcB protein
VHTDDADPRSHYVVDSDVDLHDPEQLAETRPHQWDVLAAIALGGIAGAEARYGISNALPYRGPQFPWATLITNASGCLLIGVLMSVLLARSHPHRLVRPFLSVGVLGGYTTFSTFAVDAERLVRADRPLAALGYVVASLVLCLLAVAVASALTRRAFRQRVIVLDRAEALR